MRVVDKLEDPADLPPCPQYRMSHLPPVSGVPCTGGALVLENGRKMYDYLLQRQITSKWRSEVASTEKKGYVNQVVAGVLGLLMTPSAAIAERKFQSLVLMAKCYY